MRGFRQKAPGPGEVASGDRGGDVLGRVAEVYGVDFRFSVCAEEAGGEREDAPAVGGGGLGEDADDLVGVVVGELLECEESGFVAG